MFFPSVADLPWVPFHRLTVTKEFSTARAPKRMNAIGVGRDEPGPEGQELLLGRT